MKRAGPAATLGVLAAMLGACSTPRDDRPPIVVLTVDTLRHDFVGCYGDPASRTPHLDRLARGGVTFPDAVSTTTWTLPSHLSLLTGQYPASHGVVRDGQSLPEAKVTLAEFLSARGYATGGFVSGPYLHRAYGFAQGFDRYLHCVNYGEELGDDGHVANVFRVNLRSHQGVTSPKLYAQVHAWLDVIRVGAPYFLFVHHWDPHYDFLPESPWERVFDPGYTGAFRPEGFLANRRIAPDMPVEDRKRLLDLYRGEVAYTDAWIGTLLARLRERGEAERALVIVTADHGEEFFEHGRKGHRNNLYEETLRVPLIVRGGATFTGGAIVGAVASLVDVFPTVAQYLDDAAAPLEEIQGESLQVLASGPPSRAVFAELHDRWFTVRFDGWKAIRDANTEAEELYRLRDDPREMRDLRESRRAAFDSLATFLDAGEMARFAPSEVGEALVDTATEAELRALGYTD